MRLTKYSLGSVTESLAEPTIVLKDFEIVINKLLILMISLNQQQKPYNKSGLLLRD